ncbi:Pisatin demethylase [Escovopsis weberi]|uniref:Pisatin demethylase n=1 Tax=Escovopsis weberi TaxID=150374 RepID=A0A0M9VX46_ESCWE|nr:Pisatin demethylase [Escovopsis weberi]
MSSIKAMEPFADECTEIFIRSMIEMQGEAIDLGMWLQWYAFDVISAITFRRRLGFMEQKRDIENMIHDIAEGFEFTAIVGQIPQTLLSDLLRARTWLAHYIPFLEPRNPLRSVVDFTEHCISEYDRNPPSHESPDLLGWLRESNAKGEAIPQRDLVNQLSNNFLAGSDTTAISLRAVFYYLTRHPKFYRKAQAEVDEADRDGKLSEYITYAESLQLPFL